AACTIGVFIIPGGSSSRQKHALQVYVVDPVPTLLAGLDSAVDFDDADVVVKHVDPAKCQDASIDYRSNVVRAGHISSDCLADPPSASIILLVSSTESRLISAARNFAPSRAKSTAVALPLPHPGRSIPLLKRAPLCS